MPDSISAHAESAADYDRLARECEWYGHEILFGLCHEYLKTDLQLLDVGIGTGLSSEIFAQAGAIVTGIDGSEEMLRVCRKKGFASELHRHNLTDLPWPVSDSTYDLVICCGVFHFIRDLHPQLTEIKRLLDPEGVFAFTVKDTQAQADSDPLHEQIEGVDIYTHTDPYLSRILRKTGYRIIKSTRILARSAPDRPEDLLFHILITQQS